MEKANIRNVENVEKRQIPGKNYRDIWKMQSNKRYTEGCDTK